MAKITGRWLQTEIFDFAPPWKRKVFRSSSGEFFVPSVAFGNSSDMRQLAIQDRVSMIEDSEGHLFVPLSWIISERTSLRLPAKYIHVAEEWLRLLRESYSA